MSLGVHLQAFLKDPKGVAALTPTSALATERIVSMIDRERAGLIVEYGPGSGVLTRELLGRLRPGGRLVAIELNEGLASRLKQRVRDPRLTVVHDSAERVLEILAENSLPAADYVLSGLPFFWLDSEMSRRIVERTHEALTEGGSFLAYQLFYVGKRHLRVHLEERFRTVRAGLEFRNLPPYRIYRAVK